VKIVAQSLLIFFLVLLFFIGLLSASFKFQVLDYTFWQTTFQKHSVYQNLATTSKASFESQIGKQGGNKNDIQVLTDLITAENVQDTVDRNLNNFLDFTNGKSGQINVYVPIDKVPQALLPKNLTGVKSQMTLPDLLTKFNFQDWQSLNLHNLSRLGGYSSYVLAIDISLIALILILLMLLVEKGQRFIGLGIAFVFLGAITVFLAKIGMDLSAALSKQISTTSSIASVVVGAVVPPAVTEIVSTWQIVGVILFVIGVGLFFVRKPR